MGYNRGEYLMHALEELLKGKVWPISLRRKLEDIVATAYLYPVKEKDHDSQITDNGDGSNSDASDDAIRSKGTE